MATDKKISDLQNATTINPTDTSVLVSNGADYQFAFSTLLRYVSSGISTGANITFGTTLPQNTAGNNGDVFINTSANSFAQKIAGTWTVSYTPPVSASAADGTVLYGLSVPANSTGNNNDTYINTGTGVFYQKTNNAWSQVFSMQTGPAGPAGAPGTNGTNGTNGQTILNGAANPANTVGNNGDFYINTSSWYIFGPKAVGAWPAGVSIEGQQGQSAYQIWLAQGNTGTAADFFNSLRGATGSTGAAGTAGATGAAGANGQGVPAGGTAGQILAKNSNADYDTVWEAAPSGGAYTLPVATASVLGGVKQGTGVSIAADGTLNVAVAVGSSETPLSIANVTLLEAYGDSVIDGYNPDGNAYDISMMQMLSVRLSLGQPSIKAVSGSGYFTVAQEANQFVATGTGNKLIAMMSGINDLRINGGDPRVFTKIQTCLMSFIAGCFLPSETVTGLSMSGNSGSISKTGTWNTIDTTPYGGRAPFMTYAPLGIQSVVAGSALELQVSNNLDTVVIGCFTDDGAFPNALGGFEVHILRNGGDELVMTYNPTGLNDGLLTSLANPPVAQGRMPNALIIKGCTLATLKIVTTSNLPVIIDYIGFLNAPQSCTPVMIGKIPYLSAAQYASSQATKVIIDNANAIISNVVKQFAGFPVALFDPNAVYDPNVNSSDGLHPNMAGQIIFADLLQGLILGASKPFVNPNIDQVINGLTVGQGGQTTENTNNYGAALGYGALSANQTGGSNVAIGGLAGGRNTSGSQNVFIGTEAGFANANRSNNIYIGYTAGSNSTGYSNVIIGANAQLPNANDNDSMLIRTGEGSKWIMLHEDGIHFNVSGVPVITAVGASSAVKIPFNYNGTQYYLLATTS